MRLDRNNITLQNKETTAPDLKLEIVGDCIFFIINNGSLTFNSAVDLGDKIGTNEVVVLDNFSTMADIVYLSGIYETITKAKKDGWSKKEIPNGFSTYRIGKRKTPTIFVWKL